MPVSEPAPAAVNRIYIYGSLEYLRDSGIQQTISEEDHYGRLRENTS